MHKTTQSLHDDHCEVRKRPTPTPYCRHCRHPAHRGDCGVDDCGCVRYEAIDRAAREARLRTWLVDAEFFVRNRWIAAPQQRVRAAGHAGAAMKGVRAGKQAALRPRQRVDQVRVTVTPVTGGARRGEGR
jgi:hypothetical protein